MAGTIHLDGVLLLPMPPGHEQYTRNMATAASHADLAILLIDVRLGVQTQSKRHAFICSLLGVPRLVVAVNKMDLVEFSESRFREIEAEYNAFALRLGLKNLRYQRLKWRDAQ